MKQNLKLNWMLYFEITHKITYYTIQIHFFNLQIHKITYYKNEFEVYHDMFSIVCWSGPREQWCLAYDQGRRWGHVTTNLAEAINSVLKKTRNLPISSIVLATYTRCNTYFTKRCRQITAMLSAGHVYSEYATNFLQDADSKSNTHHVLEFDRNTIRFRVEEMVNPREVRPVGKFVVRLDERWCDCGKFQKLHLPCSHVIAACASRLQHVHKSTLQAGCHRQSIWQFIWRVNVKLIKDL